MNIHEKIRQMAEGYEALTGRPVASLSVAEYLCFYDRASSAANQEIIFPSTSFSPPAAESHPACRTTIVAEGKPETTGIKPQYGKAVQSVQSSEEIHSPDSKTTVDKGKHEENGCTGEIQKKQNSILAMLQSVSG